MVLIGLACNGVSFAYLTQNVHIVVIDGVRYSETFGSTTHQYIPTIWNTLKPQATIFTRYYNDSLTLTTPGHASILSGVWQYMPNDGTERANFPTVFEYFRKEQKTTALENYVILGKDKLSSLSSSYFPEYGTAYGASVIYSVSPFDDTLTWQNFKSVLTAYHPRLTITNLAQVDVAGHGGVWDEYTNAIHRADSIVGEMWALIQSDSVYRDKTTLIVLNDHGRHLGESWPSHGDDGCDGCRHIMLMMLGPDTRAGIVDSMRRTHVDIAPTVGELLNFSTPYCTGSSIVPVIIPAVPVPVFPDDNAVNQPPNHFLQWNPVHRAVKYHVQLSASPDFSETIIDDSLVNGNSRNIGPLAIKSTYYWRISAINSGGRSAWSETRCFSTVPTAPPEVILTAPEYAATVFSDSVNFIWTTSSAEVDRYCLQIASDSQMSRMVFIDSMITTMSMTQKYAENRAVFWWRVRPHYAAGWADWSPASQFIVDIPVKKTIPELFYLSFDKRYKAGMVFTLKYGLPEASPVSIKLYSIDGTLVKTLLNVRMQQPDAHLLTLNPLQISTGQYLLDFNAGQYKAAQRFVVY